jgi:hypothetical protein
MSDASGLVFSPLFQAEQVRGLTGAEFLPPLSGKNKTGSEDCRSPFLVDQFG